MASAVDSRLAYARLSAVATASRLPTANRGSNNSYTTSWDTTNLYPKSNHNAIIPLTYVITLAYRCSLPMGGTHVRRQSRRSCAERINRRNRLSLFRSGSRLQSVFCSHQSNGSENSICGTSAKLSEELFSVRCGYGADRCNSIAQSVEPNATALRTSSRAGKRKGERVSECQKIILLTKHWEWKLLPILEIIKIGHGLVGKGQVTQKAKQWGGN